MTERDESLSSKSIVARLQSQAESNAILLTVHAQQEMVDEGICLDDVFQVLFAPEVLENYTEHRCGPCCLVCGNTENGRFLYVVCTTARELAIIITVYEPRPPKWPTPFRRGILT